MKRTLFAALLLGMPLVAQAQGMGGYDDMKLNFFGKLVVVNNAIQEITDGLDIELHSNDPAKPSLPIKANHAKFVYAEGGKSPVRILLEGNVDIKHPTAKVMAQKADWDFESGNLTFTGNPVANTEQIQGLKCEKIVINTKDDTYQIFSGSAENIKLGSPDGGGGSSDPSLLTESAVTDWKGFLTQLKRESAADQASPGKALVSKLDPKLQGALASMSVDQLLAAKGDILKNLNSVLKKPDLYDAASWKGVTLSDETKALAEKGDRTAEETTRLNRQLLAAAYPKAILGL
ncbi:MAG: hypothetical protein HYV27_20305 [Candidatus Hydrogenedentes bacterium]|nr:hypothetical protein [Candidatus Hydrogenedentota bacterium]